MIKNQLTVNDIKEKLLTNDKWLCRGLVAIYNYQTLTEQTALQTVEDNGVGFNGIDGFILSSFAKFYLKNNYLSPKQIVIARKKMVKYAGQLLKIAEENREKEELKKIQDEVSKNAAELHKKSSDDAYDEMKAEFDGEMAIN